MRFILIAGAVALSLAGCASSADLDRRRGVQAELAGAATHQDAYDVTAAARHKADQSRSKAERPWESESEPLPGDYAPIPSFD